MIVQSSGTILLLKGRNGEDEAYDVTSHLHQQMLVDRWLMALHQISWINPLHPNISMHILHTVLYRFTKVLTRIIFFYI